MIELILHVFFYKMGMIALYREVIGLSEILIKHLEIHRLSERWCVRLPVRGWDEGHLRVGLYLWDKLSYYSESCAVYTITLTPGWLRKWW